MLRKASVVVAFDSRRLPSEAPTVCITCFDPHRFHDKWERVRTVGNSCRCCIPLTEPGGALVIPEHSPLAVTPDGDRHDRVFLRKLDMAVRELGARHILPVVHFPCLAAKKAGLSDLQVIELNVAAKDRVRICHPECEVALLVHVDWHGYASPTGNAMDTFKFERISYEMWRESSSGQVYRQSAV